MATSIHAAFADPTDQAVDAFECGDPEVNHYFKSRSWFRDGKLSPPTYEFRRASGGPILGYAAVAPRNIEHPSDADTGKAKYLVVYADGVNNPFQGILFQETPKETYAAAIFRFLEGQRLANCVGLSLRVRDNNTRAIAFYKKVGFVADPGGSKVRDEAGAPHLTMRKLATP